MYSLKDHIHHPLTEAATNLHLDHIEDVILDDGIAGAHVALNLLDNLLNGSEGTSVTTKWDGSPAIVCGTHPETGRFFIGTKSVFGKQNPKIIYSVDDIRKYYRDKPGLANQMEQAFEHLQKLDFSGVLQGDLMFSRGEVKTETIDGQEYVTFKPNTIKYAIPSDSDLAEKIRRAKLGIIFHTTYTGDTLKNMSPSYTVNLNDITPSEDVWFDDATYEDASGEQSLTVDEKNEVTRHVDSAEDILNTFNPIRLEHLLTSKNLIGMIKMYANSQIRNGKHFHREYMEDLTKFIEQRIDNESIRDPAKEKKKAQYAELLSKLESTINKVFQFQSHVNDAKLILINHQHKANTGVSTFDGNHNPTKQEGFVVVDHLTKKAVKLVDRLEFSRKNFERHE